MGNMEQNAVTRTESMEEVMRSSGYKNFGGRRDNNNNDERKPFRRFEPPVFIDWVDFPPNKNTFGIKAIRLGFYIPKGKYRTVNGMRVAITNPQLMTCLVKEDDNIIYNAHVNWHGDGDVSDIVNFMKAYITLFEKPKVKKTLEELGLPMNTTLSISNTVSIGVVNNVQPGAIRWSDSDAEKEEYKPGQKENLCDREAVTEKKTSRRSSAKKAAPAPAATSDSAEPAVEGTTPPLQVTIGDVLKTAGVA